MGSLIIKDDLLKEVAARATDRGVPLEQQAEEFLRESLIRNASRSDLRKMMAEIAAMTPAGVRQTDSVEIVREARNP